MGLCLSDNMKIRGAGFDFILWFVLFKRLYEKLNRELKWFKENREILE